MELLEPEDEDVAALAAGRNVRVIYMCIYIVVCVWSLGLKTHWGDRRGRDPSPSPQKKGNVQRHSKQLLSVVSPSCLSSPALIPPHTITHTHT